MWKKILIAGFFISIVFVNYTEGILFNPAANLMSFVTKGDTHQHSIHDGIPYMNYNKIEGVQTNPVYVSMYALYYYDKLQKNNENRYFLQYYNINEKALKDLDDDTYKKYFLNCADWLVNHMTVYQKENMRYGVWEYDFSWEIYNLSKPWFSGMAQSVAVQVLLRAYKDTGNDIYLDTASKAVNAFFVEVKNGGVTYKFKPDIWWYEEYASPNCVESMVLNGMEHTLIGLEEYYQFSHDDSIRVLIENGYRALDEYLPKYDAGWWIFYDQKNHLTNYKYKNITVNLTYKLYDLTHKEEYAFYANKWSKYDTHFILREFIYQKPNYLDVAILLLTWCGVTASMLTLLLIRKIMKCITAKLK